MKQHEKNRSGISHERIYKFIIKDRLAGGDLFLRLGHGRRPKEQDEEVLSFERGKGGIRTWKGWD